MMLNVRYAAEKEPTQTVIEPQAAPASQQGLESAFVPECLVAGIDDVGRRR